MRRSEHLSTQQHRIIKINGLFVYEAADVENGPLFRQSERMLRGSFEKDVTQFKIYCFFEVRNNFQKSKKINCSKSNKTDAPLLPQEQVISEMQALENTRKTCHDGPVGQLCEKPLGELI